MSHPSNPWPRPPGSSQPGSPESESGKPALVSPMAIATELWLVVIAGQAIAYGGQYSSAADSVRDAARETASGAEAELMTSTGFLVGVFVGVGVVVTALSLLFVWLARAGHNWARLILTAFSAFVAVQAVFALFGGAGPAWTTIPTVISGVAALGAAYLLMQRETEAYCRAMATFRRGGSTPPPGGGGWPGQYPPGGQTPKPHYDPRAQTPNAYDPHAYDPHAYDPRTYDPHAYDPRTYDPNSYRPTNPAPNPYGSTPDPHSDGRQTGSPATGENVTERDLAAERARAAEQPSDERPADERPSGEHPDGAR